MYLSFAGPLFLSSSPLNKQRKAGILATLIAGCLVLSGCGGLQGSLAGNASASSTIVPSTTDVVFGTTQIGQSVSSNLSISNPGTQSIQIGQLSMPGAPFSVSGQTQSGFTVAPGGTVTLSLSFDPSVVGDADGDMSLLSAASSAAPLAKIHLHGTGAPILKSVSCATASITGAGTDACSVTLNYPAQKDVAVALTSSASAVSVPQSVTVSAGSASTSFTATIAAVTTAQTATISASTSGQTVTTAPIQLGAATPSLTASSSSVDFGSVAPGQTATQTVTLSSVGTLPVTISGISIVGSSFTALGITTPLSLNPGQNAILKLQFSSQQVSTFTGVLTIASNSSQGNIVVNLSAAGVTAPGVNTFSCATGTMSGAGSDACSLTLSGAAPTGGLSVSLNSNNAAVTVPSTVTVAANATSAAFTATVTSVTSTQTAILTATAGGASATFSLQLSPSGQGTLSVNATSLSFGSVVINDPATQSLTLSSTGTAAVTVNSATTTGASFSVSGASFPLTLNAGTTATLNVQFDPTSTGAATGQLTVASNSSTGATTTVSLSGTGQPHEVQLAWNAPSGSSDPISGYRVYRASAGSSSYTLLNSTLDAQTSYMDNIGQSGASYQYYVTTVDSSGMESTPSNTATVTIP